MRGEWGSLGRPRVLQGDSTEHRERRVFEWNRLGNPRAEMFRDTDDTGVRAVGRRALARLEFPHPRAAREHHAGRTVAGRNGFIEFFSNLLQSGEEAFVPVFSRTRRK